MQRALRLTLWAFAAAIAGVLANLSASGPYYIDFETFEPCDDFGPVGIVWDVRLIVGADNNTVYEGNLTFPYDLDDPEMMSSALVDKWGSTGGWSRIYNLTEADIFNYAFANFPHLSELFYGSMGITDHPAPAGTYLMQHFKPLHMKLKKMETLMYGRFRVNLLQSKDGEPVGCMQAVVNVNEEGAEATG